MGSGAARIRTGARMGYRHFKTRTLTTTLVCQAPGFFFLISFKYHFRGRHLGTAIETLIRTVISQLIAIESPFSFSSSLLLTDTLGDSDCSRTWVPNPTQETQNECSAPGFGLA